ncbi:MAG: hypothetical protein Q8P91_02125 [bacterium]|nr:hypothetical protein [bacterium]
MQQINITNARDRLPELMNMVYFDEKTFIVTRRGIPMIKIIKADLREKTKRVVKTDVAKAVKLASGIWGNRWKGKTTNEVVKILREKAWYSHAS